MTTTAKTGTPSGTSPDGTTGTAAPDPTDPGSTTGPATTTDPTNLDSTAGPATPVRVKGPASYFPSIERKYGRSIDEWMTIISASGLERHMELVGWLKSEHGLGHGHAAALVAHSVSQRSLPPAATNR